MLHGRLSWLRCTGLFGGGQRLDRQLLHDTAAQGHPSAPGGQDHTASAVVKDRYLASDSKPEAEQTARELPATADLRDADMGSDG